MIAAGGTHETLIFVYVRIMLGIDYPRLRTKSFRSVPALDRYTSRPHVPLRVLACQRGGKNEVVMLPFPPRPIGVVAGERHSTLEVQHLVHKRSGLWKPLGHHEPIGLHRHLQGTDEVPPWNAVLEALPHSILDCRGYMGRSSLWTCWTQ